MKDDAKGLNRAFAMTAIGFFAVFAGVFLLLRLGGLCPGIGCPVYGPLDYLPTIATVTAGGTLIVVGIRLAYKTRALPP